MKTKRSIFRGLYPKLLAFILIPIVLGLLFTYIKTIETLQDIRKERNELFSREVDKFRAYLNRIQALPFIMLVRRKNEIFDGIPIYFQKHNEPSFIANNTESAALSLTSSSGNCGAGVGPRFTGRIGLSASNNHLQISGRIIDTWTSLEDSEMAQPSYNDRLRIEMAFNGNKSVQIEHFLRWNEELDQEEINFSNDFEDEDSFKIEGTWKNIQNSNRTTFLIEVNYKNALTLDFIKLSLPELSDSFFNKCTFDSGWRKTVFFSPEIEDDLSSLLPTNGGVLIGKTTKVDSADILKLAWSRPEDTVINSYVFRDIEQGPPSYFESLGIFSSEIDFSIFAITKQSGIPEISISSQCPEFSDLPDPIQRITSNPTTLRRCFSIRLESFSDPASVVLWSKQSKVEKVYMKNIYNIIGISLTFSVATIIFLSLWIFRLIYRLKKLSSNTATLVSNEGRIRLPAKLPQADHKDEIGSLAHSLQSIFSKITRRNSYLEKISDFLKHEMGNHLNTIRLKIENIPDNSDLLNIKNHQKGIKRILEQLNVTLDAFSNASAIESALASRERRNINICSALQIWIDDYSDPDTLIHFESNEPEIWVEGASESLESAIISLLANAKDFRDEGTSIEVKLDSNDEEAIIQIKNNGPPIPEKNLNRIFKLGASMRDQNENLPSEHMGFGLFQAKYIIDNHGGDISVTNLANRDGVEFSIFLPRIH